EWPARWLVHHPIEILPRIHALDRARVLAARALGYELKGPPVFGLCPQALEATGRTMVFVHGTSREDKLWPEPHWVELGQRVMAQGWRIALPQAGATELERAERIAAALAPAAQVWPAMGMDAIVDRM